MALAVHEFDPARHIETEADARFYLECARDDASDEHFAHACSDVVRAGFASVVDEFSGNSG